MNFDADFLGEMRAREALAPKRIEALDNLLLLYGLRRRENIYGGGIVVFHPSKPGDTVWMGCWESEEEWVNLVLSIAR